MCVSSLDGQSAIDSPEEEAHQQAEAEPANGVAVVDRSNKASDDEIISMETIRAIAIQALALTVQDWTELGQGDDPTVSEALLWEDLNVGVERVTALLLVRMVALQLVGGGGGGTSKTANTIDLSTSGLCRQALMADECPWPFVTVTIVDQLRQFVRTMLQEYSATLQYHNPVHAVAVVVNCNKLLDLMLAADAVDATAQLEGGRPWTFGLRQDPMPLAALLFAALCHDAGHSGVTNRQLVLENDERALIYNDQSVQEKHSLHLLFRELLRPEYAKLRSALFGDVHAPDGHYRENYQYFRSTIISAVMSTDISSPEETETTKAKWKEAFQRPLAINHMQKQLTVKSPGGISGSPAVAVATDGASALLKLPTQANRRGSNFSEISEITAPDMHPTTPKGRLSPRRYSNENDYDVDDYVDGGDDEDDGGMLEMFHQARQQPPVISGLSSNPNGGGGFSPQRRMSNQSMGSFESDFATDSIAMIRSKKNPPLAAGNDVDNHENDNDDNGGGMLEKYNQARQSASGDSANSFDSHSGSRDQASRNVTRMRSSGSPGVARNQSPKSANSFLRGAGGERARLYRSHSTSSMESFQSFVQDSVIMMARKGGVGAGIHKRDGEPKGVQRARSRRVDIRRASADSSSTFESFAQDSLAGRRGFHRKRSDSRGNLRRLPSAKGAPATDSPNGPNGHDEDEVDFPVNDSMVDKFERQHRGGLTRSTSLDSFDFAKRNAAVWGEGGGVFRGVDQMSINYTFTSYGYGSLPGEYPGINRNRLGGASPRRRPKPSGNFFVLGGTSGGKDAIDNPHSPLPVGSPPRKKVTYNIGRGEGDEDSLSITPPSSEDEFQATRQREITSLSTMLQQQNLAASKSQFTSVSKGTGGAIRRRVSTGMVSSRFQSLAGLPIEEDAPHINTVASADTDLDREIDADHGRSYQTENNSSKYRMRLGIRRSIDFSGETLEICQRGSMGANSVLSGNGSFTDEPDYLRASAILEAILRAADVGHYLQSWSNMTRWSSRMYRELVQSHKDGRGHDPHPTWYQNQLRIMDSYLRHLALQLDEAGVFGEFTGAMFAQAVDDVKERWVIYGMDIMEKLKGEAEQSAGTDEKGTN